LKTTTIDGRNESNHDDVHGLEVDVNFTIEAINTAELAELNQELFDKLFGAEQLLHLTN
jgi:FKBP-type peptidyl-prolyl cis-trans isomerase (trigger factor)